MVQILRSREPAPGRARAHRVLRRRAWWLVLFGFLHVLLLHPGDILASDGVLALLLAGAPRWPSRVRVLEHSVPTHGPGGDQTSSESLARNS